MKIIAVLTILVAACVLGTQSGELKEKLMKRREVAGNVNADLKEGEGQRDEQKKYSDDEDCICYARDYYNCDAFFECYSQQYVNACPSYWNGEHTDDCDGCRAFHREKHPDYHYYYKYCLYQIQYEYYYY